MKVSHEFPIPYMVQGRELIDYDFCLPHLLDSSNEYFNYFLESKKLKRYIIMDNSLHELGKPYDSERLWYWMNALKPNEFIVPDYWQDKTATLVAAKSWLQKDFPKKTTPVAVVQASSKSEARECYTILKMQGYQKIAFSYGADWYYEQGLKTVDNEYDDYNSVVKAHGRYNVIKSFYKKGIIERSDRIHLLGCNIPQEFSWYKDMPFIESIDTSNPIIHGLAGIKYEEYGLLDKLPHKVDKFEGDSDNWEIVLYNVNKFKEFIPKKTKEYAS